MKKCFLRLAPLVLALVMVCGSCLTAFASTLTSDLPDFAAYAESQGYDLDDYPYYAIHYYVVNGNLVYDCSFSKFPFYASPDGYSLCVEGCPYVNPGDGHQGDYAILFRYRSNTGVISKQDTSTCICIFENYNSSVSEGGVLAANHNICDKNGNVVFYGAQSTAGQIVIGQNITPQILLQPMMREVLGLIPLLLGFIILVIAFYKGYHFLQKILHRV